MKKDLRFLQTLFALNLLPLIPFLRNEFIVYGLWGFSLMFIFVHLLYYLMRTIKASIAYIKFKNPNNWETMAHYSWKFIIMFFAYGLSSWMIYVGFKYTEIV